MMMDDDKGAMMSTLENVLSVNYPVLINMCQNLSICDLCKVGSIFIDNEKLKQSVGWILKKRSVVFDLYFEPGDFCYDDESKRFYVNISKLHLPLCVADTIHCVYFDLEQIKRLVRGAADIFFTNYFVYHGQASRFDVEKNTEQAICEQLKSMYVKSLFTIRVSLDLKNYSCSCENILHVDAFSTTNFCRESVIDWPDTQFSTGGGPHLFRFMNGDCSNLSIPSLDGGMYCKSALINNDQTIDAILNGPRVFVRNGNFRVKISKKHYAKNYAELNKVLLLLFRIDGIEIKFKSEFFKPTWVAPTRDDEKETSILVEGCKQFKKDYLLKYHNHNPYWGVACSEKMREKDGFFVLDNVLYTFDVK